MLDKRDSKAFVARRDDIARRLDVDAAIALAAENGCDEAATFQRHNILVGLHKLRLCLTSITEAEKQESREWLRIHGFDEEIRWLL